MIRLSVGSVEAANSAGFIWMFPDVRLLGLRRSGQHDRQPIAEHNPFTKLTDACGALYNGYDPGNDAWIALLGDRHRDRLRHPDGTQVRPLGERLTFSISGR